MPVTFRGRAEATRGLYWIGGDPRAAGASRGFYKRHDTPHPHAVATGKPHTGGWVELPLFPLAETLPSGHRQKFFLGIGLKQKTYDANFPTAPKDDDPVFLASNRQLMALEKGAVKALTWKDLNSPPYIQKSVWAAESVESTHNTWVDQITIQADYGSTPEDVIQYYTELPTFGDVLSLPSDPRSDAEYTTTRAKGGLVSTVPMVGAEKFGMVGPTMVQRSLVPRDQIVEFRYKVSLSRNENPTVDGSAYADQAAFRAAIHGQHVVFLKDMSDATSASYSRTYNPQPLSSEYSFKILLGDGTKLAIKSVKAMDQGSWYPDGPVPRSYISAKDFNKTVGMFQDNQVYQVYFPVFQMASRAVLFVDFPSKGVYNIDSGTYSFVSPIPPAAPVTTDELKGVITSAVEEAATALGGRPDLVLVEELATAGMFVGYAEAGASGLRNNAMKKITPTTTGNAATTGVVAAATRPGGPQVGDIFVNPSAQREKSWIWDGSTWVGKTFTVYSSSTAGETPTAAPNIQPSALPGNKINNDIFVNSADGLVWYTPLNGNAATAASMVLVTKLFDPATASTQDLADGLNKAFYTISRIAHFATQL